LKRQIVILICLVVIILYSCGDKRIYQDGVFIGESQSVYVDESYYGITKITVQDGMITGVDFKVLDKAADEIFDEKYESHFKDNPLYIAQCRNDWRGIQTYPEKFLKVQDIDKVDVITGATWSYNLFKASLLAALQNARIK
jgi:major membrane immunogen (membrane-anchored lipoprotein)